MSQGRLPSKKTGASKAALESLVKVPIAELKEDDRCKFCTAFGEVAHITVVL